MGKSNKVSWVGGLIDSSQSLGWGRELNMPKLVGVTAASEDSGTGFGNSNISVSESGNTSSITKLANGDKRQVTKGREQVGRTGSRGQARQMEFSFMGGVHNLMVG